MKQQIDKYFGGELDEHEKRAFLRQVKSDKALRSAYISYQNELALFSFSNAVVNEKDSQRHYSQFIEKNKRKRMYMLVTKSMKYAAVFILLIFSVYSFYLNFYSSQIPATETSLYVPASQRIQLTLQDGTEVWLNAQTRLTYPTHFSEKERRVTVEGEAFFKVAKDDNKPFIVTSNDIDIRVLGTEFNIHSYPEESTSRVSLIEGSLQIELLDSGSEKVILKPNEEVCVQNNRMLISPIQDADYFLWRDGIYSFTDEKLGEIFKKLELYYDIEINVKNPSILEWKYTVKFRQRDGIDEILRLLQRIHKFSMTRDEENNMITIE